MGKVNENKALEKERDAVWSVLKNTFSKSINVIAREVGEISKASRRGKLNLMQSSELRSYTLILGQMVKQHKEIKKTQEEREAERLSKMNDEEFEKEVRSLLKKPKVS